MTWQTGWHHPKSVLCFGNLSFHTWSIWDGFLTGWVIPNLPLQRFLSFLGEPPHPVENPTSHFGLKHPCVFKVPHSCRLVSDKYGTAKMDFFFKHWSIDLPQTRFSRFHVFQQLNCDALITGDSQVLFEVFWIPRWHLKHRNLEIKGILPKLKKACWKLNVFFLRYKRLFIVAVQGGIFLWHRKKMLQLLYFDSTCISSTHPW